MEETVAYEQEAVSLGGDARGRHRILAELARVEQEVLFLEKELEEVENTDIVSTVCQDLLCVIEKGPIPSVATNQWTFELRMGPVV